MGVLTELRLMTAGHVMYDDLAVPMYEFLDDAAASASTAREAQTRLCGAARP